MLKIDMNRKSKIHSLSTFHIHLFMLNVQCSNYKCIICTSINAITYYDNALKTSAEH